MRYWLAGLALWMAMTAALAQSEAIAVKVDFTYRGVFAGESVRVGTQCFVTPSLLEKWGWIPTPHEDEIEFEVDGRMFRLPLTQVDNRSMVDFTRACEFAGARATWNEKQDTYSVRGSIRNIELTDVGIRVDGTLPFQVKSFKIANPNRLVMDFVGTELEERLVENLPEGWRVGKYGANSIRVVIEHPQMATQIVPKTEVTRSMKVMLRSVNIQTAGQDTTPPLLKEPVAAPIKPAVLGEPVFKRETERETVFTINSSGGVLGAPSAKYITPTQVQINMPNANFATFGLTKIETSNWVSSYTLTGENASAAMVINLKSPMAFQMGVTEGVIKFRLFRPQKADGNLEGKVIIVDAGHGGKDSGSRHGNVNEKDIVLPIARLTAKYLNEQGAAVVLTRDEDNFVTLGDRSKVANASNASLFVSIHVNSNSVANSRSGGMTFYHQQDPVGMLLAECIQAEIAKVSKIPTMGTWSDRRIYQSGFAVLRNSKMPSVLIELGFINHSSDRARLVQAEFREAIAQAIVRGVKVFLGDDKQK